MNNRLDRAVDPERDHTLGAARAEITLVEFGSYDCPHCRAANARIGEVRDQLGDRVRYVFRHRPISGSELARRAAELVEQAQTPDEFWSAHVSLMTRSRTLTEDDLRAVADDLRLGEIPPEVATSLETRARERVDADVASSHASGVRFTPTFFINSRRYDGPWDETSFTDAMLGSLGHRVRVAALGFASWAPSTGLLLLLATLLAVILTNTDAGPGVHAILGDAAVSRLRRRGVQHVAAALGERCAAHRVLPGRGPGDQTRIHRRAISPHGAAPPCPSRPRWAAWSYPLLYMCRWCPPVPGHIGWGVPMATDTAFAVALIAIMGARVPVELRIFLTAAAIVDDIGAIIVVAIFYSDALNLAALAGALAAVGVLVLLNRSGVYRVTPYVITGVLLWVCVHAGGLHATLAGVLLAAFIPTRKPPDYQALALQAEAILAAEASHGGEQFRFGPSEPALRELDAIHDRLESPADRLLRNVAPRSSYLVLPIFALANAGVVIAAEVLTGHGMLMAAIVCGLAVGKPAGFILASWLAVKLGIAEKPAAYSWRQLAGAGALAGIGFTMSLFIAGAGVSGDGRFCRSEDCGLRGVGAVGHHRCGGAVGRPIAGVITRLARTVRCLSRMPSFRSTRISA